MNRLKGQQSDADERETRQIKRGNFALVLHDVQVIGPLYFAHGPAVLEAVFASLEEWPAPCPGALCPLPFLSETVMFQVPEIDMPPQVASKYR